MADNPQGIDSTPKAPTSVVSSGSGLKSTTGINDGAVSSGDFAYGHLGNGDAGGLGNAALFNTNTILPNTRRTQIAKADMEAADKEYTRQMNLLSQHWSVGDTTSDAYLAQKQNAMASQYQWELKRNNLEEVAVNESADASNANRQAPISIIDDDPLDLNLTGLDDLSPQLPPLDGDAPDEASGEDIVVTGHKAMDPRIRLRPKERIGNTYPFFGDEDSVLYMLNETNGVFFPYTPTITMNHKASYQEMAPTHANTSYYTYTNTPAIQIQISGQFSAQNLDEAKYTLAAMHFFRSATKMHFGEEEAKGPDPKAGLPPPPLVLSGYGEFMFNELTVVLTDFSMDLPADVDYLEVTIGEGLNKAMSWVPSLTTFNITCVVQQTPRQQREDFNLTDFVSGAMFGNDSRKGWI